MTKRYSSWEDFELKNPWGKNDNSCEVCGVDFKLPGYLAHHRARSKHGRGD